MNEITEEGNKQNIYYKEGEQENIKIFESQINNNICIHINKNNNCDHYYYLELDLETLATKSKIFKICDSPNEVIDIFSNYLNQNKYTLKELDDNSIILNLQVVLFNGKEENIEFKLLKIKNEEDKDNKIISELKKKVNNLENEIFLLKEKQSQILEKLDKIGMDRLEENFPAKPITAVTPISNSFYPGCIIMCASNKHPNGNEKEWLKCNGAKVKIDDYPNLFAVLGETYGPTGIIEENEKKYVTFTLPNFEGRVPWGGYVNKNVNNNYINPGLPNIWGNFALFGTEGFSDLDGAIYHKGWGGKLGYGHTEHNNPIIGFDARRCNKIYGDSNTVQPPAIVVSFYIKT